LLDDVARVDAVARVTGGLCDHWHVDPIWLEVQTCFIHVRYRNI
jgi:hypothetical protein